MAVESLLQRMDGALLEALPECECNSVRVRSAITFVSKRLELADVVFTGSVRHGTALSADAIVDFVVPSTNPGDLAIRQKIETKVLADSGLIVVTNIGFKFGVKGIGEVQLIPVLKQDDGGLWLESSELGAWSSVRPDAHASAMRSAGPLLRCAVRLIKMSLAERLILVDPFLVEHSSLRIHREAPQSNVVAFARQIVGDILDVLYGNGSVQSDYQFRHTRNPMVRSAAIAWLESELETLNQIGILCTLPFDEEDNYVAAVGLLASLLDPSLCDESGKDEIDE